MYNDEYNNEAQCIELLAQQGLQVCPTCERVISQRACVCPYCCYALNHDILGDAQ